MGEPKKAQNFSEEEVRILVEMYVENKDVILGKFNSAAGAFGKKRIWNEILEAVNAVGANGRTLDQVKKKLKNLKQGTKTLAVANTKSIKKTGGGSDEDEELDDNQEKLLTTISTRQIHGIPGGLDIHEHKNLTIPKNPQKLEFTAGIMTNILEKSSY